MALVSALLGRDADGGQAGQAGQQGSAVSKGPKVLVCAQSNAAVDELALRLSRGVLDRGSGLPRCSRHTLLHYYSCTPTCAIRGATLEQLLSSFGAAFRSIAVRQGRGHSSGHQRN